MCSTCYNIYHKYVLNNQPAKHSRLINCKCGKLTRHSALGFCKSCYHEVWYQKNQDKRLKQEKNRRTKNKKIIQIKKNIYNKKYYEEKKKDRFFVFVLKIRKYSYRKKEKFEKLKNHRCEDCGSKDDLQIHHNKYTLDFNDWQLLCRDCHSKIHRKYNKIKVMQYG